MRVKSPPTPRPSPQAGPAPKRARNVAKPAQAPAASPGDGFQAPRGRSARKAATNPVASGEPALLQVGRKLPQYEQVEGTPFDADGVSADDVVQGGLGDCFFLSALASLAQRRPAALQRMVVDHGDGTYTVTLYAQHKGQSAAAPVPVTLDGKLPELPGKKGAADAPVFASSPDKRELWVALVEKAAATLAASGYRTLNRGGSETDAMLLLTGQPAQSTDIHGTDASAVYDRLKAACDAGQLTTAGTFSQKEIGPHLQRLSRQGLTPFDPKTFSYDKEKLVEGHAYTVLSVGEQNGQKYVELRNPWADTVPDGEGDGKDDGVFKMPLAEFAAVFQEYSVGG